MSRGVYRELKLIVRRWRVPFAIVLRARMLLRLRAGAGTQETANALGCSARTVRKWRARFASDPRAAMLHDAHRSGRPATVSVATRCELVELACERPDDEAAPFRDIWTYAALADALHRRTGVRLSVSEVGRILRFHAIRPHRVRQWLKSRDPDFTRKAERICDLYLEPPEDTVVLCIDEKPMQVLSRRSPTHVDKRDGSVRYEFEYRRHGTQVLLAAFNIKTGRVFGRVVPQRTAAATVSFVNTVAHRYRGKKIIIVWDNLNTHFDGPAKRWTKLNERHQGRLRFVHTPIHASWMNQIEIWFSILHRRILKYGDFPSAADQKGKIDGFIRHWNRHERHPFRWTWRATPPETSTPVRNAESS